MVKKTAFGEQDMWNGFFTLAFLILLASASFWLYRTKTLPYPVSVFDFFLLSLAAFRLIRLFMHDSVTDSIRDYLSHFEKGPRKTLSNLLGCPWCTGMWMALIASFLFFSSPIFWYLIFILALAGAGSIIQIIILKL